MTSVDVVVIGAGQAGLSAAYHLKRRGFSPLDAVDDGAKTFVVLDADDAPGGAWQHRWDSLRMATVNGIYELPGMPVPEAPGEARANELLPEYFADYEEQFDLRVRRPVRVSAVEREASPSARLTVRSSDGTFAANYVINATGTWTRPFMPAIPGAESFAGTTLHVADYRDREDFRGKRVVIVGAGVSALQLLDEISHVADTFWVTRKPVKWDATEFDTAARVAAIAGVEERVRRGEAPGSVISVTGHHWTPLVQAAEDRGVLVRHPMFTRIVPTGVVMPDGAVEHADVILWATGFRAELRHLAPLQLRTPLGGVRVENGRSLDEPRLFLIGYGPSQSTVGANRAGRDAAKTIVAALASRTT